MPVLDADQPLVLSSYCLGTTVGFAERVRLAAGAGFAGIGLRAENYWDARRAGLDDASMLEILGTYGVRLAEVEYLTDWCGFRSADQQIKEQTIFHIHTHLTIFVNGQQRQVPAGIGIPGAVAQQTSAGPFVDSGTCFYWLHTHAADGIVHIESPVQRTFTLGEFFDEWGQPLSASQVGPAKGKVSVIVNGKVWKGDPRNAPLGSRENLQLEVGTPLVAPETINWPVTGL